MGIFSFLKKKGDSERVLLISVGSSRVSGALVTTGEKLSTIRASISTDIAVISNLTLTQFEKEMEKALRATLASLTALHLPPPHRIVVTFSSPWYASQVRLAKMSRPAPFVITKALVNDMIARELKAFEEEEITGGKSPADAPKEEKTTKEALRAIESKVIQIKLNGYAVPEPFNVSAREIEISMFLSIAPESTLSQIEDIIGHEYKKPITFSSFAAASFLVVRDFFPHQENYLLLDIGGEVTDVTLVRDSALVQSASFPLGRNFMLRKLAVGLQRSIPESIAICGLFIEDKVEPAIKDACAKILNEAKDQWLEGFQKTLFSISDEISIPDTVLLSAGAEVAPWFIETIRREKFNQYALNDKELKVILLNAEIFHDSLAFAEGVQRNSFILIEALASTRLGIKGSPLSLQKKSEETQAQPQ